MNTPWSDTAIFLVAGLAVGTIIAAATLLGIALSEWLR